MKDLFNESIFSLEFLIYDVCSVLMAKIEYRFMYEFIFEKKKTLPFPLGVISFFYDCRCFFLFRYNRNLMCTEFSLFYSLLMYVGMFRLALHYICIE